MHMSTSSACICARSSVLMRRRSVRAIGPLGAPSWRRTTVSSAASENVTVGSLEQGPAFFGGGGVAEALATGVGMVTALALALGKDGAASTAAVGLSSHAEANRSAASHNPFIFMGMRLQRPRGLSSEAIRQVHTKREQLLGPRRTEPLLAIAWHLLLSLPS